MGAVIATVPTGYTRAQLRPKGALSRVPSLPLLQRRDDCGQGEPVLKHIVAIRVYVATAQQLHRLPERHAGVGQLHAQVVDRPLSYFNTLRRGLRDKWRRVVHWRLLLR